MASSSRRQRSRAAQLRHCTSHPGYHVPTALTSSSTYILTFSSLGTPLRQIISSPRSLRTEVERQRDGVLVINGREGWRMAELVGVDGKSLEAAVDGPWRSDGVWWMDVAGRVGVFTGGRMPVMLVDEEPSVTSPKKMSARDMMSHMPSGSRVRRSQRTRKREWDTDGLEERLAEKMATMGELPEVLCSIVFERWADYLFSTGVKEEQRNWTSILVCLERNAETSRRTHFDSHGVTYTHWTDLITRTTLRHILLSSTIPLSSTNPDYEEPPQKTSNERSLDRVTYLGGLLLPMTVVSSILAIEGPYGPTGSSFWVFWVASGISSLVAVAVIYVDQMRRVDVWVEAVVTGDDGVMEVGFERERREKMWRRGELGWKGAVKRVSGMERLWPSEGVRFQRPAVMEKIVMDV